MPNIKKCQILIDYDQIETLKLNEFTFFSNIWSVCHLIAILKQKSRSKALIWTDLGLNSTRLFIEFLNTTE